MHTTLQKLVVKVGTNVLSQENGLLDLAVIEQLVADIAALNKQGVQVVLVSSGAVGSGRAVVRLPEKTPTVTSRQVLAAVGQVRLMNTYSGLFEKFGLTCAQVLVTKEDFRDKQHYFNMQNCLEGLLTQGIVPIVNENDVVSVTELMFTDNDELSGLIASMLQANALVILTNVDGVFDGNPSNPASKLIPTIDTRKLNLDFIAPEKSTFGRGGMLTKAGIAHKLSLVGIAVKIANGKTPHILSAIAEGNEVGTTFVPQKTASSVKRRIAHSEGYEKGSVVVNAGAARVLASHEKAASVLPVGIVSIEGDFQKGDIVKINAEDGTPLGYGMAQYDSALARERLGRSGEKPLIHYDYLFLKQ